MNTLFASLAEALDFVRPLRRRAWGGFAITTEVVGHDLQDAQVVFAGGVYGTHALQLGCSTPKRILAHFEGYCRQSGVLQPRADSRVTIHAGGITRTNVRVLKSTPKRCLVSFRYRHQRGQGTPVKRWYKNSEVLFEFCPAQVERTLAVGL